MEEALTSMLLGDTSLAALVGTRVNWLLRPQANETLPAVTLQKISGIPDYDMDGASGLVSSRVQIDAWGDTYGAARGAIRAAIAAISGFSGTVLTERIQAIFVDGERDFQGDDTGGVNRLFRASTDIIIWHCPT